MQPQKTISIRIPEDLYWDLKHTAVKERKTVQDFVKRLIEQVLEKNLEQNLAK